MIPWGHLLWIIPVAASAGYVLCGLLSANGNDWMYDISPEEQERAMDHWRQMKSQSSDVKRG